MSSILTDVKHALGLHEADTAFDSDVIMHTNSVLAVLTQLGVGPEEGVEIADTSTQWSDIFTVKTLNAAKSYVYLRVKLLFDPPPNGYHTSAIERQITELEYRINVVAEFTPVE